MNELHLDLAGIRISVTAEEFGNLDFLEEYLTEPAEPTHRFRAMLVDRPEPPDGSLVCDQPGLRVYRDGERMISYRGPVASGLENAYLRTERRGEDGVLEFIRARTPGGISGRQLLPALELPHLLTIHGGFLLHASYIAHEGRAILFTAPSETGKSTQAQLWCDHAGAKLVNGDRAAVRIMDGTVYACGTPYSGSSPVRQNVKLPLAAIVSLSQAPENSITRLRGARAFRRVWEGCTVNTWDRSDVELATGTVSDVIGRVPVYHLACTPDSRAVELLKHSMEVEIC